MFDISKNDLIKFLTERKANPVCPSCSKNDWMIPDSFKSEWTGTMVFSNKVGMSIPPPHIPTATLVCNNCGYTRSFALAVVDAWKKSSQAQ